MELCAQLPVQTGLDLQEHTSFKSFCELQPLRRTREFLGLMLCNYLLRNGLARLTNLPKKLLLVVQKDFSRQYYEEGLGLVSSAVHVAPLLILPLRRIPEDTATHKLA